MSLKFFHILFIVLATLMALLFGVWGINYSAHEEGSFYFFLGIGALLFGVLLVSYGIWFLRKIRKGNLQ